MFEGGFGYIILNIRLITALTCNKTRKKANGR